MTTVFMDPVFERHLTGVHPENPERLAAIRADTHFSALTGTMSRGLIRAATRAQILSVHAPGQLTRAEAVIAHGGGYIDPDTALSVESLSVAMKAAGTAMAAVDVAMSGTETTALALIRPPGHHASDVASMGFCLFNNVAIAARYALTVHKLERILIVDWDVHHGNGTQDIFYGSEQVFFFSIHRSPFYPGSGLATETGTGQGLGFTLNLPVTFGTPRAEYVSRFTKALEDAAAKIKPELVLISAGFDAHRDDPIGSLGLESEDFATLTERVKLIARHYAGGRIVSCLEGGYNRAALAASVTQHLGALSRP